MSLEGLLAQIKSAVPKGKSKSYCNAERLAWLSYLGQLLRDHVGVGRADCRPEEDRHVMLESGVPLEHIARASSCQRVDRTWFWSQLAAWKAAHPEGTQGQLRAEMGRLTEQWAGFSGLERGIAVSGLANRANDGIAPAAAMDTECVAEPVQEVDLWDMGDARFPLRPAVLLDFLHHHSSTRSAHVPGIANKARAVRLSERGKLVVEDQGTIPDTKVYSHRHPCSELHPGLCAAHDRMVYSNARALAANLEVVLNDTFKHRFFSFSNGEADDEVVRLRRILLF